VSTASIAERTDTPEQELIDELDLWEAITDNFILEVYESLAQPAARRIAPARPSERARYR
jgi:hypothetical protein